MAGISSKAAGRLENKLKFIHQPLDDDLGLNWYQFKFRNHDPQIGRFVQVDPLAAEYVHNSTYAYAENRVINSIDLEGLEAYEVFNNFSKRESNPQGGWIYNNSIKMPVNNPYNLGKGTVIHNNYDFSHSDGTITYSSETIYIPEKKSKPFSCNPPKLPQLLIFGNGTEDPKMGSKPDYTRPIHVFNFKEFRELMDLIGMGYDNATPSNVELDPTKPAEIMSDIYERAYEENPNNPDAKRLKANNDKRRSANAGIVHCDQCNDNFVVDKDSNISRKSTPAKAKDTIETHEDAGKLKWKKNRN
jgi:RHS repeat-associated protein